MRTRFQLMETRLSINGGGHDPLRRYLRVLKNARQYTYMVSKIHREDRLPRQPASHDAFLCKFQNSDYYLVVEKFTNVPQVEGPLANGVVQCHMVMPRGQGEYEYKYLFVDIKGHERIYLENADTVASRSGKKPLTFFGVKWG